MIASAGGQVKALQCDPRRGLPAHHSDPFDQMLVAQALAEPLRLVTSDMLVSRYSDTVILV